MTLPDLIARLQSARSGSRALDYSIHLARQGRAREVSEAEAAEFDSFDLRDGNSPDYSTSIDDAMSLVPDIWRWKIAHSGVGKGTVRVELWTIHYVRSGPTLVKAKGYIVPAAICAAALQIPATLSTPEQAA